LPLIARIVLETAAALIALGGLYDLFTPRLPPNLVAICGDNEHASRLVRQLLRALGGSLVAIGLTVAVLVAGFGTPAQPQTLLLVLLLVIPSEGINAFCMYRVGSPYYFPLAFVLLTVLGVVLGWPNLFHIR
jgi:hypothetical protein